MRTIAKLLVVLLAALSTLGFAAPACAWGALGHRVIASIAMKLIPQKGADIDFVLRQLEMDADFIDAASYPDEFIRDHDPDRQFSSWHFANLPDDGTPFVCAECLFTALQDNLAAVRTGSGDKSQALAIAWVMHLVGDLHQPLHMSGRLRGGNDFAVTYRGRKQYTNVAGRTFKVELHSAWDDCLVEELANGRDAQTLANDLLGEIKTYKGRPEIAPAGDQPWLAWGEEARVLANTVAFDDLRQGADLDDRYIKGPGKALEVIRRQLLAAGIRLAYLLDKSFRQRG
jgi:hypothetical protein